MQVIVLGIQAAVPYVTIITSLLDMQVSWKAWEVESESRGANLTIYRSSCERHRTFGRRLGVSLVKMEQEESQGILSGHA